MNELMLPTEVDASGERFQPTPSESEVALEHVHRYWAAARLCAGKTVLDVASGEGYGCALLAAAGASVTGVEIDRPTIEAARRRYPSVTFVNADVTALPFEDGSFDVVTSFETIEHVANPTKTLDELRRVLRPGGLIVVSTPDKTIYNGQLAEPNPFHVHELERGEFQDALAQRFRNVALYGQRVVFGSLLASAGGASLSAIRRTDTGELRESDAYGAAVYLVAVCSDGDLPALPESIYEGGVPPNALSSLLGGIVERDRRIGALTTELTESALEHERKTAELAGGVAQRDRQIAALQTELSETVADRDGTIAALRAELSETVADLNRTIAALQSELSETVADRDRTIAALRAELSETVADRDRTIAALRTELSETVADLNRTIAALQSELSETVAVRDRAIAALRAELSETVAVRDRTIAALQAELSEAVADRNRTVEALDAELSERDRDIAELKRDIAAATESSAGDRRSVMARRARIIQLLDVINQVNDDNHALERQLREAASTARAVRSAVDAMAFEAAAAARPLAQLKSLAGDLLSSVRRLRNGPRAAVRNYLSLRAIRRSGLFSPSFYVAGRADLAHADPVRHYLNFGASEGRAPSAFFSPTGYVQRYPSVALDGHEPLAHYVRFGRAQGWSDGLGGSTDLLPDRLPHELRMAKAAAGQDPCARDWKVADQPSLAAEALGPYDKRPDDPVPREAARGQEFVARHGLLSEAPDFDGAVAALNALPRPTCPLESPRKPAASVVVPVYGQLGYTLNTLHALLTHRSKHAFEVIVVDDASPDGVSERWLPRVEAIRYHRQAQNGGFIKSSNTGAGLARGEVVVMLNNDTRVVEGWLDELVDTLRARPEIGLVGSKLFYPDATLQEAGGIVWREGSAWNYGRNDDPNRPEYCYARPVDYVSGCSIALPADLWRELGGFDPHYTPAYCEDSDLAFRVRAAGRETWMQPLSRVIHYEGKTSGTDVTKGVKAYQAVNTEKLYTRWRSTLAAHRPNGEAPHLERDRAAAGRVLVLEATAPTPDQDAGSVVTIKIIEVFQRLGYKVVFAPLHNFLYQPRYIGDLQRRGVECLYAPYCLSIESHLRERGADYDIVHVFRPNVMSEAIDAVRAHCPNALVTYHPQDLHYLREERQAAVEGSVEKLAQARANKAREIATMARADFIFVLSAHERAVLKQEAIGRPVEIMPYMIDPEAPVTPGPGARDVLFLGGYGHPPNVDAVKWFHAEIWPTVAAACPEARFVVAGANPPPELRALESGRVVVTGRLDDLRPAFAAARVFVAPLRYGAGVKGKIYSAMSFGAPIVTTGVGAEGIGLAAEEHVLVADNAAAFAAAVVRVFRDRELEQRLRAAGPAFVARHASLEAGVEIMRAALERLRAPASASVVTLHPGRSSARAWEAAALPAGEAVGTS